LQPGRSRFSARAAFRLRLISSECHIAFRGIFPIAGARLAGPSTGRGVSRARKAWIAAAFSLLPRVGKSFPFGDQDHTDNVTSLTAFTPSRDDDRSVIQSHFVIRAACSFSLRFVLYTRDTPAAMPTHLQAVATTYVEAYS
jgi:hypothetical protein